MSEKSNSYIDKYFPTFNRNFLSLKKKLGWDSWDNWHPKSQTLVKLFPIILIALAIPLTVGFLQQQQNLNQEAAKGCHGNNPYCNTPTVTPSYQYQSPTPTAFISQTPTPTNSPSPTLTPTISPTPSPSPTGYTFYDDFNGTSLSSSWTHYYHCCGVVTMDNSLSNVSGGYLHLNVVNRNGTWYGTIIDTKNSFKQTYGYYEARILVPKGVGLWPAFWLYNTGNDEIDTMEICSNPVGTNGGNDARLLHTTVHYGTGQSIGSGYLSSDLSLTWHIYAVDWRADHISFFIDGIQVWKETSVPISTPQALLLNLGLGGSWCGNPTSATPTSAEMLVDWVRVSP
ncbi:MAG TPA: family 16 glycosylhydrolase [Candidatus Sulfotelmatobacter sp.]|nr:family 16 glycosylhydrolase [Candidatus Sulfotelmatobacter sp.]